MTVVTGAIIKRCACGRTFTVEEWSHLALIGFQRGPHKVLEQRECPCTSTISIRVPPVGPPAS